MTFALIVVIPDTVHYVSSPLPLMFVRESSGSSPIKIDETDIELIVQIRDRLIPGSRIHLAGPHGDTNMTHQQRAKAPEKSVKKEVIKWPAVVNRSLR